MTQERKTDHRPYASFAAHRLWGATLVRRRCLQYFIPVGGAVHQTVWHFWPWFLGGFYSALIKRLRRGLSDHCRDKADLFLRDPVSDPGADRGACVLEPGSSGKAGSHFQLFIPGIWRQCRWISVLESGNQVDRRGADQLYIYVSPIVTVVLLVLDFA